MTLEPDRGIVQKLVKGTGITAPQRGSSYRCSGRIAHPRPRGESAGEGSRRPGTAAGELANASGPLTGPSQTGCKEH